MANRGSLLSGSDFESIGRKGGGGRKPSGGRNPNDKIKIGLAAGLLVVAALLLAWNFGVFDRRVPAGYTPPTQEEVQAHEERVRQIEEMVEQGVIEAPAGE